MKLAWLEGEIMELSFGVTFNQRAHRWKAINMFLFCFVFVSWLCHVVCRVVQRKQYTLIQEGPARNQNFHI